MHDANYLASIASMSSAIAADPTLTSPVPFTPLVQRSHGISFSRLKDPKACDTRISAGSFDAARRAAGAVLHAVDAVPYPNPYPQPYPYPQPCPYPYRLPCPGGRGARGPPAQRAVRRA